MTDAHVCPKCDRLHYHEAEAAQGAAAPRTAVDLSEWQDGYNKGWAARAAQGAAAPPNPAMKRLLDECRKGPWTPEGGIDYDEDKQVVWLTNAGQDSLRLDASDVALLLNERLSEEDR